MFWFVELSPAVMIFLSMSVLGTFMVLFSTSLLGVWFGLECNFFGFIPILNSKSSQESESAVKYFIIQGLGSGLVLCGVFFVLKESSFNNDAYELGFFGMILITMGMMVKVGLFPFHFWFPSVMSSSSWFNCFMLSTWQKFGLFFVLTGIGLGSSFWSVMMWSGVLTAIVGAVGGLQQVYLRVIMAYSSLVHSGWMLLVGMVNKWSFMIYFVVYSIIIFFFFFVIYLFSFKGLNVSMSDWSGEYYLAWAWFLVGILTVSGIPPLLGSVLKLVGIWSLMSNFFLELSLLIMSSLVSLFFYLTLVLSGIVSFISNSWDLEFNNLVKSKSMLKLVTISVVSLLLGVVAFMSLIIFLV